MSIKKQEMNNGEYFVANSFAINDANISMGAKCVLMYLYSHAEWWKVRKCHIQEVMGIKNITTLNKYIKELEDSNYLRISGDVWHVLTNRTTIPKEEPKAQEPKKPKAKIDDRWVAKVPRELATNVLQILQMYHVFFNGAEMDDALVDICINHRLSDETLEGILQFTKAYPDLSHARELMHGLSLDPFWNDGHINNPLAAIFSFATSSPQQRYSKAMSHLDYNPYDDEIKKPPHLRDITVMSGDPSIRDKLQQQALDYAAIMEVIADDIEKYALINLSNHDQLTFEEKEKLYRQSKARVYYQKQVESIQQR